MSKATRDFYKDLLREYKDLLPVLDDIETMSDQRLQLAVMEFIEMGGIEK